ncbi:MAG: hypothetical protein RBR71_01180 [Gudongella sp.]|nr:hypothetical protein [Gudongella sp.]
MNSPIILLIVWAVFNILIKSSKDKKKAQNAKRKSGETTNIPNNTNMSQRNNKPQKKNFRQTIEEYRAQIEKEFAMETQAKQKPIKKEPPVKKQPTLEENRKTFREGRFWKEEEKPEVPITLIQETEISDAPFFDIKEDILKGVIYSEILNKPKSLQ